MIEQCKKTMKTKKYHKDKNQNCLSRKKSSQELKDKNNGMDKIKDIDEKDIKQASDFQSNQDLE